jgi:hypothetical protein
MWAATPMRLRRGGRNLRCMPTKEEMQMRFSMRQASAAVAALAVAFMLATAALAATRAFDGLGAARDATSQFKSISLANKAGYGLLKDKNGISCIAMDSMPGMGAMGVHYAKPALVGDGKLDVDTPEALVYQPVAGGKLSLAAVEYVVLKKDWDKKYNNRPVMFGHTFNFTPAGNRFGLPAYYSLHVWIFKKNPSGEFTMWNPLVKCK